MLKDDKEVQDLKEPIKMLEELALEIEYMINTYTLMKNNDCSEPKKVAIESIVCSLANFKDQLDADSRRFKGRLVEHLLKTGKI